MAHEVFRQFASKAARFVGLSWTFMLAVIIVIAWTVGGLLYGFSDTWLLVMNTVCSVTTFLVVFIIQKDGTVKKVAIRTHIQDNEYIEVLSGIKEGDEVVSAPYNTISKTLKDGMKVMVVPKEKVYDAK